MSETSAEDRIKRLVLEIRYYAKEYYEYNRSVIPDKDYDDKLKELKSLIESHPEFDSPDLPIHQVMGKADTKRFSPVRFEFPMLSLDNVFNLEELTTFHNGMSKLLGKDLDYYCAEPKYDGLSIYLRYENGKLVQAATRGDGRTGENITENAKMVQGIPLTLKRLPNGRMPKLLDVRGEVLMAFHTFEQLNEERIAKGEQPFSNTRNAASGSLRQLNPEVTRSRHLTFAAYYLGDSQGIGIPNSHFARLMLLKQMGFSGYWSDIKLLNGPEQAEAYYQRIMKRRETMPYPIDGVVFKVDTIDFKTLVESGERAPKYAIAYKFPAQEVTSTLKKIVNQVGRSGTVTPVAEIDPVEVGGVTVSRVTLHNYDEVKRLDLHESDTVVVKRAGDVIPKITRVIPENRMKDAQPVVAPTHCPSCHSPLVKDPDGVFIRCLNGMQCPDQRLMGLKHYVSRNAMDIDDLGENRLKTLIDAKIVLSPLDLYNLPITDVSKLEGFSEKITQKIVKNIEDSRHTTLPRFLYALGIPLIGLGTATVLANELKDLKSILRASKTQLKSIKDIGDTTATAIHSFFEIDSNLSLVSQLEDELMWDVTPEPVLAEGFFNGKTFVITGSFKGFSRDELKARIEAQGGKVTGSLSKKTTALICGENPGGKRDKALVLNCPIWDESIIERELKGETK